MGYRPNTKINAVPSTISTPAAIHGARFGFPRVAMMLSNKYSLWGISEDRSLSELSG
jgi:hypothetical protein